MVPQVVMMPMPTSAAWFMVPVAFVVLLIVGAELLARLCESRRKTKGLGGGRGLGRGARPQPPKAESEGPQ